MPKFKLHLITLFGAGIMAPGIAQPIDPEEAIVGIWAPDWAAVLAQSPIEDDGRLNQSFAMYTGMVMEFGACQIGARGEITMCGTPIDEEIAFLIKPTDNGGLLLLPDWTPEPFPIDVRFEGPNKVIAKRAAPDPRNPIVPEFVFHRIYGNQQIDAGEVNAATGKIIEGEWAVDRDRLQDSAIAQVFPDPDQRSTVLDYIARDDSNNLKFSLSKVSFFDEQEQVYEYQAEYEVVASDENAALLLIHIGSIDGVPARWWRLDVIDQDHLTLWRKGLQVPLIRKSMHTKK